MTRGNKVRPNSPRKSLKALLEEVIVEEGVTKEALIEVEDQTKVTLTLLV